MTISITIRGNAQFCREHAHERPELLRIETWPCHCVTYGDDGAAEPSCPDCHGSGELESYEFAFEMNLANGNFGTLWCALGYEPDLGGGELPADEVGLALSALQDWILERAERHEPAGPGPAIVHCGIGTRQAHSYIERLHAICEEACERGQTIVWH